LCEEQDTIAYFDSSCFTGYQSENMEGETPTLSPGERGDTHSSKSADWRKNNPE
jgi:hypothetical protein